MIWVLIIFSAIAFWGLPPVLKGGSKNDLWAFLLLFISALVLALLQTAGVEVPSATIMIWKALRALGITYPD